MNVSTIMLVKDPPMDRLAALVEYLRFVCDEFIVVIDTRTSQADIDIIAAWPGVVVVPFEWVDDFSAARNAALPFVTRGWTLHLDPDELPSIELMRLIQAIAEDGYGQLSTIGYLFWTPNWWGGWKGPEEPYHWHIRMWRSGRGRFYRAVHELVAIDGQEESMTRERTILKLPKQARLIHSKPWNRVESDQAYYEWLGERSM